MKVEILKDGIAYDLYSELDYPLFLSLFEQNQPLLPSVLLSPMSRKDGIEHYSQLEELESRVGVGATGPLLELSSQLPSLNHLLGFLENGTLQQYHLFELGTFIQRNTTLCQLEVSFPLDVMNGKSLNTIERILERHTEKSFSAMRYGDEETKIQNDLNALETGFLAIAKKYDREIFESTGIKLTYPWPKELILNGDQLGAVKNCPLLTHRKNNEYWILDYEASKEVQDLQRRRTRLTERFESLLQNRLDRVNHELAPLRQSFLNYYNERVKRIWFLVLLAIKEKHNLCFPQFTATCGCEIKEGFLFSLHHDNSRKCTTLDLNLSRNASILYGSNMSGKTTVLKTVYWLLSLIQFGLPIPAQSIKLHYPEHVFLMLKSSGDLRTGISTYGEELSFFSQPIHDGSYILADELFLSTDPINGAVLSGVMIRHMRGRDCLFLCTTHYPEMLDIENVDLYRMEDPDPVLVQRHSEEMKSMQNIMPYRLVPITSTDHAQIRTSKMALETALLFDLPTQVQAEIKKYLRKTK